MVTHETSIEIAKKVKQASKQGDTLSENTLLLFAIDVLLSSSAAREDFAKEYGSKAMKEIFG